MHMHSTTYLVNPISEYSIMQYGNAILQRHKNFSKILAILDIFDLLLLPWHTFVQFPRIWPLIFRRFPKHFLPQVTTPLYLNLISVSLFNPFKTVFSLKGDVGLNILELALKPCRALYKIIKFTDSLRLTHTILLP